MGQQKINNELQQIVRSSMDETYQARIQYANQRGKRIQFIEQLKKDNVTGKDYSDAVVQFDEENLMEGWRMVKPPKVNKYMEEK